MIAAVLTIAVVLLAPTRTALAQDFSKTLLEERMTLDGRRATVTARHIYYKEIVFIKSDGAKSEPSSGPRAYVQIDIAWADGERYILWRQPASAPLEVEVEYRVLPPTQPLADVEAWRRHGGDRVLLVSVYGGTAWAYMIDPKEAMPVIPEPPVLRQIRGKRHAEGEAWAPISPDDIRSDIVSPLFKAEFGTQEARRMSKRAWSALREADFDFGGTRGAIRVVAKRRTITVFDTGLVAADYDVETDELTYRPITKREAQLLVDAPHHAQPVPQRAWEEYRRHAEVHGVPPDKKK